MTAAEFMEAGRHAVAHLFAGSPGVVHEWGLTKCSDGELCLHCDHCESEVTRTGQRSWAVCHAPSCPWLRADPPFDAETAEAEAAEWN